MSRRLRATFVHRAELHFIRRDLPLRHCAEQRDGYKSRILMMRCAHRYLLFALLCSLSAVVTFAVEGDLNSLLKNSPFESGSRSTNDSKSNEPLEFRGVLTESGVAYFSIYETSTSRSAWVRLNEESSRDYTAKRYDWENRQLTIEYQGRDLVLSLAADSSPAPIATPVAAAPPAGATATKPTISEAQKLNNIAAEIKRRRALRQQAIKQTKRKQ